VHAPAVVPSQADQLSARVRHFAIRILRFLRTLARDPTTDGIARQIARSAPSVWANYRSPRPLAGRIHRSPWDRGGWSGGDRRLVGHAEGRRFGRRPRAGVAAERKQGDSSDLRSVSCHGASKSADG